MNEFWIEIIKLTVDKILLGGMLAGLTYLVSKRIEKYKASIAYNQQITDLKIQNLTKATKAITDFKKIESDLYNHLISFDIPIASKEFLDKLEEEFENHRVRRDDVANSTTDSLLWLPAEAEDIFKKYATRQEELNEVILKLVRNRDIAAAPTIKAELHAALLNFFEAGDELRMLMNREIRKNPF